ncbi:MAG: hypothetical protein EP322_03370 [Bacteroidetes bacterium]|nr:MAG: hypothetical protein EP322_03370 [Bacteroidota bacterium]
MNYERYEDWVRVSFKWIRDAERDAALPHHIQLLGIEDAELRGIRYRDIFDEDGTPKEDSHGILLVERYQIKAHLWVLGAYEVIRMLSQRVREDSTLTSDAAIKAIQSTKKLFERVRIPIAKLEASKRHQKTDYQVALPGMGPNGIAWKVSDDVIISQEALSDKFHKMMTTIKPPKHNNSSKRDAVIGARS